MSLLFNEPASELSKPCTVGHTDMHENTQERRWLSHTNHTFATFQVDISNRQTEKGIYYFCLRRRSFIKLRDLITSGPNVIKIFTFAI
jgi:hypothetical protein